MDPTWQSTDSAASATSLLHRAQIHRAVYLYRLEYVGRQKRDCLNRLLTAAKPFCADCTLGVDSVPVSRALCKAHYAILV
uniref:Uncharacterized protein n=1 Tax=Physcomitrium patens TaxID=3218 RepID=A0A2K1L998_PHYPA|nr:hypothetical protein PHYPA_001016 [Physcomitrium patens]